MLGAAALSNLELDSPPSGPVQVLQTQPQGLAIKVAIVRNAAFAVSGAQTPRLVRGVKVSPARQGQAQTVALTTAHVRAAGYTTTIMSTAGLVSYWKLGERSGTTMKDLKGASDGTLLGAASTLGAAGLLTNDSDTAIRFAGTAGSYVDCGDAASLQLANGSIEGWVQINNGTSAGAGLFGKLNAFALWCAGADGRLAGLGGNAAPGYLNNGAGAGPVINDGQRHYVAMTFQGGVTNGTVLYVDGVAIITGTIAAPTQQNLNFAIGEVGGLYVTGVVDEVAVYNTVLTPAQIAQHYSDGVGAIGETRTQAQSLTRTTAHVRAATFARTQAGAIAVQRAVARTRTLTQAQQFAATTAQNREVDATQAQSATRAGALSRPRAVTQAQAPARAGAASRPGAVTQAQTVAGARSAMRGRTVAQALALARSGGVSASTLLAQSQARARSGALSRPRGVGQAQGVASAQSAARGRTAAQAQFTALVPSRPAFSRAQGQLSGRLAALHSFHAAAQGQDPSALTARPLTRRFAVAQDQAGTVRASIAHRTAQGQAAALGVSAVMVTISYGQQGRPSLRRTIVRRRSLTGPQAARTTSARIATARQLTASMALALEASHLDARRLTQAQAPAQRTMDIGASVNTTQRQRARLVLPLVRGGTLTVRLSSPRTVSTVGPATGLATGVGDRDLTTTLGS